MPTPEKEPGAVQKELRVVNGQLESLEKVVGRSIVLTQGYKEAATSGPALRIARSLLDGRGEGGGALAVRLFGRFRFGTKELQGPFAVPGQRRARSVCAVVSVARRLGRLTGNRLGQPLLCFHRRAHAM